MYENNDKLNLGGMRKDYISKRLDIQDTHESPFRQFQSWLEDALAENNPEPTAMTLSTVDGSGRPSSRIVLLKGLEKERFLFFSNYLSRKGKELEENPFAALLFFWPESERQVRIEGTVARTSRNISETYFHSRPWRSQVSAFISPQSKAISDRISLEKKYSEIEKEYSGKEIPCPEFWGGYELIPERMEFWQGRPDRLHDRILYVKGENGKWGRSRLAP